MKNIILCSDGTGNQDIKGRGTNVFKLFEAIDIHSHKNNPDKVNQVAFYDDGVGTSKLIFFKLIGGAFGWGLKRNVIELYTSLVRVYTPGDRIYLFGFSRGAYTVRTLSGLIRHCGVIDAALVRDSEELNERVNQCWDSFKENFQKKKWLRRLIKSFKYRDKLELLSTYGATKESNKIHFIGVWDTVSAIMPLPVLADLVNFVKPFRFPDFKPGDHVCYARHALAIDDERKPFHPDLWDEKDPSSKEQIKQVWFAGSHSNVGGGYSKHGMSLEALHWMMREAEDKKLNFIQDARSFAKNQRNVNDKLYDPRSGFGLYYRWRPRNIADLCAKNGIGTPLIHESVIERILSSTEAYSPGNIPYNFEIEPADGDNCSETKTTFKDMICQFKLEYDKNLTLKSTDHKSKLDEQKWQILLGRLSYLLFIVFTVLSLVYALFLFWSINGKVSVCNLLIALAIIPSVGFVSWGIAYCVDKKMINAYDSFWSPVRKIVKSNMQLTQYNNKQSGDD